MKKILSYLLVAIFAALVGWYLSRQLPSGSRPLSEASGGDSKKLLYYQSPMHPWIKAEEPGKCTICGMDLVPVYEGGDIKNDGDLDNLIRLSDSVLGTVALATSPVVRGTLTRTLRVQGLIEDDASQHRYLVARTPGRVEKLFVESTGLEIKEGAPLLEVYSPELQSLQGEFLAAIRNSGENSDAARSGKNRLLRFGLLEKQIAELAKAGEVPWTTGILSPFSGTVVSKSVSEGQQLKEGDRMFELGDFSTMWFLFDAFESDLGWLKTGAEVLVETPALPREVLRSTIDFIDPNLSPETRATKVRVLLDNPVIEQNQRSVRRRLPHGAFASGLVASSSPDKLLAPRSAVLDSGTGPVVFVEHSPGAYEPRAIRTGMVGDDRVEVLSGLKEGERLVTYGALYIDAQSRMQGITRTPLESTHSPTAASTKIWTPLIEASAAASEALAADDFAALKPAAENIGHWLAEHSSLLGEKATTLKKSADDLIVAHDLPSARKVYEPLADGLAGFALGLEGSGAKFYVFECPMAPQLGTARWIQAGDTPRNPLFGSEMLDCAIEVRRAP